MYTRIGSRVLRMQVLVEGGGVSASIFYLFSSCPPSNVQTVLHFGHSFLRGGLGVQRLQNASKAYEIQVFRIRKSKDL